MEENIRMINRFKLLISRKIRLRDICSVCRQYYIFINNILCYIFDLTSFCHKNNMPIRLWILTNFGRAVVLWYICLQIIILNSFINNMTWILNNMENNFKLIRKSQCLIKKNYKQSRFISLLLSQTQNISIRKVGA